MNNFLCLVHCQIPIHPSKLCLKFPSSVHPSLSPGLPHSAAESILMPRFLQQLKELWAETTGRPVSCRVPLPGVFLRTPVSSGATHPAQLLLLPLRLVSHIPGATSLGSATPFLVPAPSFLAQLPPVTGLRSSVAAQSMHRPETNFQKGVGAARTGKLQIGGAPCSGCPCQPKGCSLSLVCHPVSGPGQRLVPNSLRPRPSQRPSPCLPSLLGPERATWASSRPHPAISCSPLSPGSPSAQILLPMRVAIHSYKQNNYLLGEVAGFKC